MESPASGDSRETGQSKEYGGRKNVRTKMKELLGPYCSGGTLKNICTEAFTYGRA